VEAMEGIMGMSYDRINDGFTRFNWAGIYDW